jgi:hypothetical protein
MEAVITTIYSLPTPWTALNKPNQGVAQLLVSLDQGSELYYTYVMGVQ